MIHVVGFPQDNNSSFMTGPALAPARIREAIVSPSANMTSETGVDLGQAGLWENVPDVMLNGLHGQTAFDAIKTRVANILADGHAVLGLGGDHSVSYPAILAHASVHPKLSILHIDAHCDLYADFEGNPYSHASPFARLMESGHIARLVQVGIRTLNPAQQTQVDRYGVEVHHMRDLSGIDAIEFEGPVYVSLDLDGLDPAFAPGVSHHEPGGLSTRQVLRLIQTFRGHLIGGDVVELNPLRDINGMTAMVAAKCAKEMIARMVLDAGLR